MARQKVKGISISSANATGSAVATSGYVLKADGSGGADWGADSTAGSTPTFTAATISASDPVLNIARTGNYTYKIGSLANDTFVIQSNETSDASYASLIEIDSYAHQGSGPALKIDSSGRVGIGTSSPADYVYGDLVIDGITNSGNAAGLSLVGTTYGGVYFADGTSGSETYRGFVQYNHNHTSMTDKLLLGAGGDTRMVIDSSGNVGIGETTPLAKLHIKRGDSGLTSLNAAGDHIFLENTGANGTGITLASGNTANGSIIFGDQDSNYRGVLIYDHSADAMKFVTAAAERTRIQATGKTAWSANGIGDVTSVPRDFAFYTEGSTNGVEVRSNDERLIFMGAGGSGGTAVDSGYLAIANGGTTKIALNANGTSDIGGGPVNMSLQPAFDAGRNAGYVTDDQNFIQDSVRTNIGSHYNSSNGRFTAPVAGQYLVMFRIFTHDSGSVVQAEVKLKKNGGDAFIARAHKVGGYHTPVQITKVITLAANDYIQTYVGDSGTSSGWMGSAAEYNYFGAFLIG